MDKTKPRSSMMPFHNGDLLELTREDGQRFAGYVRECVYRRAPGAHPEVWEVTITIRVKP